MAAARTSRSKPTKRPFDIEETVRLLREAVAPYPKAALFELAGDGHTSVFELLVACLVSVRTRKDTVYTHPRALATASALGHADVNPPEPTA